MSPPLPDTLAGRAARTLESLNLTALDPALAEAAARVFALSDFAAVTAGRQREWLADVFSSHGFDAPFGEPELAAAVEELVAPATDMASLQRGLRRARQRFQLWLVWRHELGVAPLEETMGCCSLMADVLIEAAYRQVYAWTCERRGTPWGEESDRPQHLVVLALGKLGGRELNLSSDVDLIFTYPEPGQTRGADGARGESNQQFFVRLGQQLIQALDTVTPEGFVFRVDMRLRPFGGSGPLAMDFGGIEDYYATQGRDWERYALMKARPCAGEVSAGEGLLADLKPFVFRRYLDFGAIDSLRDMKRRLVQERQHPDDVKLGPGGIRDVEFGVQMQQMIWGGREPSLQVPTLLEVLPALIRLGHLEADEGNMLAAAYRFLRDTEHSLQAEADQQTQRLPAGEESRLKLALSRGFEHYTAFCAVLDEHRGRVAAFFDELLGDETEPDSQAVRLWRAPDDESALETLGFNRPEEVTERLRALQTARDRAGVSSEARARLERLMPVLLDTVSQQPDPDLALDRVVPVIRAVMRRSAYLVLLSENPKALGHCIALVTTSLWIARNLEEHPAFLDALLQDRGLESVPGRDSLLAALQTRLAEAADEEVRLNVLGEYKSHFVFDVALAEVRGTLPLMKVSDALTFLAEAILEAALALAWRDNVARFPEYAQPGGFLIVGYGKLGGIELGPGSDLDLVFLHDLPGSPGPFLQRLARRLLHLLTAPAYHGALYEIDTRLRPSGSAGTMVSSLEAFEGYQRERAWVWEQQALVRARPVAGDGALARRFEAVRRALLCQPRDTGSLATEVLKMRRRLAEHHRDDEDLKQGSGGIVDIEFMVQYLVLAHAHEHPSLTEFTDNVRILDGVEHLGLLPADLATRLREAYLGLRSEWHRGVLDIPDRDRAVEVLSEYRSDVREAWRLLFGQFEPDDGEPAPDRS